MKNYYLHKLDGQPAVYVEGQGVCFASFSGRANEEIAARSATVALNIDADVLAAWLKSWWERRKSGYGPEIAHLMRGVADMIEMATTQPSPDAQDAARYRWLRQGDSDGPRTRQMQWHHMEILDAAIDSALSARQERSSDGQFPKDAEFVSCRGCTGREKELCRDKDRCRLVSPL